MKCYIFLVFAGLRFYCVMIVLKKFRMSSPALFYSFRLIFIVSGCSQMDEDDFISVTLGYSKIMTGLRWFQVTLDDCGWFWVVCCFSSYAGLHKMQRFIDCYHHESEQVMKVDWRLFTGAVFLKFFATYSLIYY